MGGENRFGENERRITRRGEENGGVKSREIVFPRWREAYRTFGRSQMTQLVVSFGHLEPIVNADSPCNMWRSYRSERHNKRRQTEKHGQGR